MKLDNINMPKINREMIDWYHLRTNNHINCVRRNCEHLAGKYPDIGEELVKAGEVHDGSKFEDPEYSSYILITWRYKCADEGKEFEIPGTIDKDATFHHIKHNKHHPEYWSDCGNDVLNSANRDKPSTTMVDGSGMSDVAIAEMCCDWHAVSLERGNTAKDWADSNINVRWAFTDDQISKIYEYLAALEDQTVFVEE